MDHHEHLIQLLEEASRVNTSDARIREIMAELMDMSSLTHKLIPHQEASFFKREYVRHRFTVALEIGRSGLLDELYPDFATLLLPPEKPRELFARPDMQRLRKYKEDLGLP